MSIRCRSDLLGCKARILSSINTWRESMSSVEEIWNDATARTFYKENFTGIEETLSRVTVAIQEGAEMVRSFERAMEDDQR